MKSQKHCVHPRILLLWQKVCVKRLQHKSTVVLNNWTFRWHHWDEFCIKTLVWRHTKPNWFRSWSHLTIKCVFVSLSGPVIDLQKMPILAKIIIFSDESHFERVNKQNCRIWGTEIPLPHVEKSRRILRGGYWQHLPHSKSYTRCFAPCVWRSHYQLQSWFRLATSELPFATVGLLFVGCRQR